VIGMFLLGAHLCCSPCSDKHISMLPDFEQDDFVTGEFIWLDLIIVYRILKSFSVLMLLVV